MDNWPMPGTSPRSPELMSKRDTALLVVDMQTKLLAAIPESQRLIWNISRLIDGARITGVLTTATEQYPQGLGPTTPELAGLPDDIPAKTLFSCRGCDGLFEQYREKGIQKVLLAGIEAHVCVQQTAFDLFAAGFQVYLAVDACGSRFEIDYSTAVRRMDSAGVSVTTTEAALFEWCEDARAEGFKAISSLVRQTPPAADPAPPA